MHAVERGQDTKHDDVGAPRISSMSCGQQHAHGVMPSFSDSHSSSSSLSSSSRSALSSSIPLSGPLHDMLPLSVVMSASRFGYIHAELDDQGEHTLSRSSLLSRLLHLPVNTCSSMSSTSTSTSTSALSSTGDVGVPEPRVLLGEDGLPKVDHAYYSPSILQNAHYRMYDWVDNATFNESRNRYECLHLAKAIDFLIKGKDVEAMEVLTSRLAAVHSADANGDCNMCSSLEYDNHRETY